MNHDDTILGAQLMGKYAAAGSALWMISVAFSFSVAPLGRAKARNINPIHPIISYYYVYILLHNYTIWGGIKNHVCIKMHV